MDTTSGFATLARQHFIARLSSVAGESATCEQGKHDNDSFAQGMERIALMLKARMGLQAATIGPGGFRVFNCNRNVLASRLTKTSLAASMRRVSPNIPLALLASLR